MSKISKARLEKILDNILAWGADHDDEFMQCLVSAAGLTLKEAEELAVEEYHKDYEQRVAELKELFRDLAKDARDCDELEDWLESEFNSEIFTRKEYDYIVEHWDEWLPKEEQ